MNTGKRKLKQDKLTQIWGIGSKGICIASALCGFPMAATMQIIPETTIRADDSKHIFMTAEYGDCVSSTPKTLNRYVWCRMRRITIKASMMRFVAVVSARRMIESINPSIGKNAKIPRTNSVHESLSSDFITRVHTQYLYR